MFTGIVEELGEIVALDQYEQSARMRIRGVDVTAGVRPGHSIAVDGVCLTVTDLADGAFTADVMRETLTSSCLGALEAGSPVNLERPLTPSSRLGGHLLQGHVDGTGEIVERLPGQRWEIVRISVPDGLGRYLVAKGSIAVDGVSLTVVDADAESFTASLIPETLERTTLGRKRVNELVNLEVDVVAKHVEKSVERYVDTYLERHAGDHVERYVERYVERLLEGRR